MPGPRTHRLRLGLAAAAVALATFLGGCSLASGSATPTAVTATRADDVLDETKMHAISVEVDETVLKEMIQKYLDTGDKEWIKASVTIDGETFGDVGIKLKGNSSLRRITIDTPAADLPLRIRLDKYVDNQDIDGYADFTVRSNSSETAMNEAVALDLLADADLATEEAIATRFSVNGSGAELRLTVQNLDDTWVSQNFPDAGDDSVLYKSDADGDWSWRGADGDYTGSFEVEAGGDDYAPLIKLLDLVNNGTAAEITEQLPALLNVESFARYLAYEEVIDNFDDIDGPGNNSYLFWDSATNLVTIVAWDHNLAFGDSPARDARGGQRGAPGSAERQTAGGADHELNDPGSARRSKENPLSTAFLANTEWKALYEQAKADLQADLVDDGTLTTTVDQWSQLLTAGASDLVSAETIATEADKIRAYAD